MNGLQAFGAIIVFAIMSWQTPCPGCEAAAANDTIPHPLIEAVMQPKLDSLDSARKATIERLKDIRDSLAVEVEMLKRDRKKKLVLGDNSGWITDRVPMPDGTVQYWNWYFYRYKDGSYKYAFMRKTKYPPK